MLEGAVGTIAAAHVFATFANLQWGTELFGPLLLTAEILAEPLDYSDFHLTVPETPGLRITLDEDRVQFFRRDRATRTVSLVANDPGEAPTSVVLGTSGLVNVQPRGP